MESNIPKNIDPFIKEGSVTDKYIERESWKDMVQKLYSDVSTLLVKEGQLIRTELNEKTTEVKTAAVSLIGGGVVLFVGLFCVAATAIILLDLVTELWLASVIVTVVFLAIGGFMLASAKKKLEADKLKPNKSIDALGEIGHTLKEKVYEITKH
jgi:hypothetical protein